MNYAWGKEETHTFWLETLVERDYLRHCDTDGRIILNGTEEVRFQDTNWIELVHDRIP